MHWYDRRIDELEARVAELELALAEITGEGREPPWGTALTNFEFRLVNLLADRSPRYVRRQSIMAALYPVFEQPDKKIIDVWVCRARKQMAAIGLGIETVWGEGYRMTRDDAAAWIRWCDLATAGEPAPADYPLFEMEDAA